MNTSRLSARAAIMLLASAAGAVPAHAQSGWPVTSSIARMGGGVASPTLLDAVSNNPAALMHTHATGRVFVSVAGLSTRAGGDLFDFTSYRKLFESDVSVAPEEVHEILQGWFGSDPADRRGIGVSAQAYPVLAAVRERPWAVAVVVASGARASSSFSRSLPEMVLAGLQVGDEFQIDGSATAASYGELRVLGAYRRDRLALGAGLSLFTAGDAMTVDLVSHLTVTERGYENLLDLSIRGAGAGAEPVREAFGKTEGGNGTVPLPFAGGNGSGVRAHLGATWDLTERWTVGLSLLTPASVHFDGAVRTTGRSGAPYVFEGIPLDVDRIQTEFDNDVGEYVREVFREIGDTEYDTRLEDRSFSVVIPGVIQAGAAWTWGGSLLHVDATSGWLNTVSGFRRGPGLRAGAAKSLGPLVLDGGIAFGESAAMRLGFGLGLKFGPYSFGIAANGTPRSDLMGRGLDLRVGFSFLNLAF